MTESSFHLCSWSIDWPLTVKPAATYRNKEDKSSKIVSQKILFCRTQGYCCHLWWRRQEFVHAFTRLNSI